MLLKRRFISINFTTLQLPFFGLPFHIGNPCYLPLPGPAIISRLSCLKFKSPCTPCASIGLACQEGPPPPDTAMKHTAGGYFLDFAVIYVSTVANRVAI